MAKQLFLIPNSRLVRVTYWANGTRYETTIANPKSNDGLQVAMLTKHIGLSQVASVQAVKEWSTKQ